MTAGAQTLSLEETLLEPQALPPPPTRHALLVILIALAALLHVATIGSGDLYSQTVALDFISRLRPEIKFPGIDALLAQIQRDIQLARSILHET